MLVGRGGSLTLRVIWFRLWEGGFTNGWAWRILAGWIDWRVRVMRSEWLGGVDGGVVPAVSGGDWERDVGPGFAADVGA